MSDPVVSLDGFSMALEDILNSTFAEVREGVEPSLKKALRAGVKKEKELAPVKTGDYKKGITSTRRKRNKDNQFGEIGNRKKPGLAHLLEKGHAKDGGGYVAGIDHISTAATVTFEKFEKEMESVVERALND